MILVRRTKDLCNWLRVIDLPYWQCKFWCSQRQVCSHETLCHPTSLQDNDLEADDLYVSVDSILLSFDLSVAL